MKPIIFGFAGTELSTEERDFFCSVSPFGFILFQRNCDDTNQIKKLTSDLREAVGRDNVPIFIDQEGGRVARLKPPNWKNLPAFRKLGMIYEKDKLRGLEAMAQHTRITAHMLRDLGINGNCSPVLDLFVDGASQAIGDRALSGNPETVAALGRVAIDTFLNNGVLPVIKHLPGHGRVVVDPHLTLPTVETERSVLEAKDFAPFVALNDAPIGMNCHVVFKALDPVLPVSMSAKIHIDIIRGYIGFKGLLFSDDIAMKALNGALDKLTKQVLAAGADVALYCPGTMQEMKQIAASLPEISAESIARWNRAQSMLRTVNTDYDPTEDFDKLEASIAQIKICI